MKFAHFIMKDEFEQAGIRLECPASEPQFAQVELTTRCNLECFGCINSKRQTKTMSLDKFNLLLGKIPNVKHISFVGAGESLLVPHFEEYIKLCHKNNIITSCTSNGVAINARLLNELVCAGLNRLAISVDAASRVVLGKIRPKMTVDGLKESLRLSSYELSKTNTELLAAITLSDSNISEFEDIIRLVADCGVREVTVQSLHHWGEDTSLNKNSLFNMEPSVVVSYIESGLSLAENKGLNVQIFDYNRLHYAPESLDTAICCWPWDAVFIDLEGNITPCCINLECSSLNFMGNIFKESIGAIWSNKRYEALRDSFIHGKVWGCCAECVYRKEYGKITR